MIFSDIIYDLFTVCNSVRLVSYLPQMYKIARDTSGAAAISYWTWILWTAANGSTAIYSFTNLGDITLAWTNGLNALCCIAVIWLTVLKRRKFASTASAAAVSILRTDGHL